MNYRSQSIITIRTTTDSIKCRGLWRGFFAVSLILACFIIVPGAPALNPPPDGGYTNFTTAEGQNALFSLTTGVANTAVGWFSLWSNATGEFNTANGAGALLFNNGDPTMGEASENTAFGAAALLLNTTGSSNTATGATSLLNNADGFSNTANGAFALHENTSGDGNTANGQGALSSNTTGSWNTAIGYNALGLSTGDFNIALGFNAGVNPTNSIHNIHIGNTGLANDSETIRIGQNGDQTKTFIAGIFGVNEGGTPSPVYISEQGQLGTVSSSRRFKNEIRPMDKASEAILCLKPVTFHYKSDHTARPQFGLIAEEVAEVNPDLVVHDKNGEIYSVRYDQVNAMLLNEFLKEHRTVEELKKEIAALAAIVKEQAAQIQKVSTEFDTSKNAQLAQAR
jgi:hypothetical protein